MFPNAFISSTSEKPSETTMLITLGKFGSILYQHTSSHNSNFYLVFDSQYINIKFDQKFVKDRLRLTQIMR